MPTDLNQMFAALRADADTIPLADPAVPRRLGERRRRNRLGLVALATVLVLVAVTGGATWIARDRHRPEPLHPAPVPTVDFTPLQKVGPGLAYGAPAGVSFTSTVGDRAYVGWQQTNGDLRVGALDLTTGRQAWPPRTLGRYGDWNGLVALPQGLVVIGEHNNGATPDYTLFVVDPGTGKLRWQREFDINGEDLLFFEAGVVLAGRGGGSTRALNWRTGAPLWSAPAGADPVVQTVDMRGPADLGWYSGQASAGPALNRGVRLVQATAAGTLLARDVRTGAKVGEWPGAVPAATGNSTHAILAYDGRVFVAGRSADPFQVRMVDLGGPGGARVIYTADKGDRVINLTPCFDKICLVKSVGNPDEAEVVVIDPADPAGWMSMTLPARSQQVAAARDWLLATGGSGGLGLLKRTGQVFIEPYGPATAGWVTDDSLLVLATSGSPDEAGRMRVEFFGVHPGDGRRRPLGVLDRVFAMGCSWNESTVVCPTSAGFGVWRFARP